MGTPATPSHEDLAALVRAARGPGPNEERPAGQGERRPASALDGRAEALRRPASPRSPPSLPPRAAQGPAARAPWLGAPLRVHGGRAAGADAAGHCLCPHCQGVLEDQGPRAGRRELIPAVPHVTRYRTRRLLPELQNGSSRHAAPGRDAARALANALRRGGPQHGRGFPTARWRGCSRTCGLASHGALVKQVRRLGGWLTPGGPAGDRQCLSCPHVNADGPATGSTGRTTGSGR